MLGFWEAIDGTRDFSGSGETEASWTPRSDDEFLGVQASDAVRGGSGAFGYNVNEELIGLYVDVELPLSLTLGWGIPNSIKSELGLW
jgi:hypothetical protein